MKARKPLSTPGFLFAICLLVASAPSYILAQSNQVTPNNQTGLAPYNTFAGDHENVNLATSDLNLQIPLVTLPGRDHHDVTLSLQYDSRLYELAAAVDPFYGFQGYYWTGVGNGGWRLNLPGLGKTQHCDQLGDSSFDVYQSDFIVTLADGAKHHFQNKVAHTYYEGPHASCQEGNPVQGPWGDTGGYTADGSVLSLDTSSSANAVLRFKDGSSVVFYNYLGQINQIDSKDSNGNVISYLSDSSANTSTIKDSLGRVITVGYSSISYGSGLATILPTSVSYTDSNGAPQTITIGYSTQTIAPTFSAPPSSSLVGNAIPSGPAPYLTSITLPNNRSYTMQYNNFGELTKITYPAGGYTRYAYSAVQGWYVLNNNSTSGDVRVVTNSYACANSSGSCTSAQELVTSYNATRGAQNSNNTGMTVTDPLGNYSTYTFSDAGALQAWVANCEPPSPRELTRTMYDGSGSQLRSVATDYNTSPNCGNGTTYMFPIRRTTTLENGLVTKTEWDYETVSSAPSLLVDNVVEERIFDYGSLTVPAVKHRTAYMQVNPLNNVDYTQATPFILDRKASEQVYDSHTGSDVLMAQTTYEYDNYTAGIGASGATQHDPAFNTGYATRGNVTASNHWRNTDGAWLTTRSQYDDAGNVLSTTDPLGHLTQFSYADNFTDGINHNAQAYATQITDPPTAGVSHIERKQYFYGSGLVAASCGENFSGASSCANTYGIPQPDYATYVYDGMNRPVQVTLGDGGGKIISYNDVPPVSTTTNATITSALNLVTTSILDGLGRTTQAQLVSDPEGVDYTDTTYDVLGRVSTISNPYRSTSDPTYGLTQTQYDGLGRITQVTKQDGSLATVSYTGNCTTATDEAGKQRKSCSDALGRLVEVDEPGGSAGSAANGGLIISGQLQGGQGAPTSASVTVTIGGSDGTNRVTTCTTDRFGVQHCTTTHPSQSGTIQFTVNVGATTIGPVSVPFDGNSTASSLAAELFSSFPSNSVVTMSNPNGGAAFTLTTTAGGISTNSSTIATSMATNCTPQDGDNLIVVCGGVGWTMTLSGPNLAPTTASSANFSGGADGPPVTDAGTVTLSIPSPTGNYTATANYGAGQDSTADAVASDLVAKIQAQLPASNPPFSIRVGGTTINVSWNSDTADNVTVTTTSTTTQTAYFSQPSFASCTIITNPQSCSTVLGGGAAPAPPSLSTPWVTLYQYDALGNLLRVDQKGSAPNDPTQWHTRLFTYNSLSQLLSAYNPESGTITYNYDADGNLLQKTSPPPNAPVGSTATQTVSHCYDALHRVTGKAYSPQTCTNGLLPAGTALVSYNYDQGTNGIGRMTSLTDQAGSGTYIYDGMGRISSETRAIAGFSKSMSYDYNLDGSLSKLHYPSGAVVTYTPAFSGSNSAGRTGMVQDSDHLINYVTGTSGPGSYASYGADGSLTGFVSGNASAFTGITNSFSFNKRLQPVTMSATSPSATVFSLTYDFHFGNGNNGNVYGITNNKDNTRNQTFTYDQLNRLTSAQNAGTDCSQSVLGGKTKFWGNNYGYDAWGNLTSKTVTKCTAENLSAPALANNQLTGYGYDAAGNMTNDPTDGVTATYDAENRIATATKNGVTTTYTYDDDGNRVEKTNGSTGTLYWYMAPGIVGESDLSGNLTAEYVFFEGERVARKDFPGGAVSYYFSDHLKTTDIVTDAQGNIKNESDFYPWGGELQFINNDSNHYKFTGKERDSETGLDYFGARYYSNGLGRFITPDWSAVPVPVPYADLSDPQSLNQYSYVRNIPTVKVDADGHDGGVGVLPSLEEVAQALKEIEAASAAGGAGVSLSAILTGVAITFGPVMIKPDILPGGHVGQSNADEIAERDRLDAENAPKPVAPAPQTQPAPQAQGGVEAKRESSRTIRRKWEKAKGKKWPKDKEGNNYDADHKKALADKGTNHPRNIQPRTRRDHVRRHQKNGDFRRWARRRKTKN